MSLLAYLKGIGTYVPGLYPQLWERIHPPHPGQTDSARYCYSIWLRHLVMASRRGLPTNPQSVAELGPGDSLGTGIAALLSGAVTYYALDVVQYAPGERNLRLLDELVDLFRSRAPIPSNSEFSDVEPHLPSYDFPAQIFDESRFAQALAPSRVESIRRAVKQLKSEAIDGITVCYRVPWDEANIVHRSLDMVFSQAVLEHVDKLRHTYQTLSQWLKPTGYMSHTIDYRSHGTARKWNGHWSYSDLEWKLVCGKRPWVINRQPHSIHLKLAKESELEIISDVRHQNTDGISRKQLARSFQGIPEDDLKTDIAFIQAVPRNKPSLHP